MPVSARGILPRSSTAVASVNTRLAPPIALLPRCTRCQGCGWPSFAEYSHIGETTIRFFSSISRIRNGLNSFILGLPEYSLSGFHRAARPEERRSDAHFRGAFFDRYFKIVGHPHR